MELGQDWEGVGIRVKEYSKNVCSVIKNIQFGRRENIEKKQWQYNKGSFQVLNYIMQYESFKKSKKILSHIPMLRVSWTVS